MKTFAAAMLMFCVLVPMSADAQNLTVYDDALQNGFQDYSYGGLATDFNFNSTAQLHGGFKSIAYIGRDFNALCVAHPTQDFTTVQRPVVRFWVHGGASGGQQLRIYLQHNDVIVAQAELDSYISGGSIAAGQWREVVVNLGAAPLSYAGSFDRIDLQSDVAGTQPVLYVDDYELLENGVLPPSSNMIQIEHGVTVASMVSDRFTWHDSLNKPRVAVLAHNDGQIGPIADGGYVNRGGALREFRYQMPNDTTRIVSATNYGNGGHGGFGYVVSHRGDGSEGGIGDDSPLGYAFSGSFQRVFEGRHHAIFRFTQLYPRYSSTTADPPNTLYQVPVTIDWIFSTGRDHPVWAVTWDLSAVPPNALNDDSRAPYGELNIDGTGAANVDGVAWGDRYKFSSTTVPVTLNSHWTWNVANSVPWVKLWIASTDATMGTVQTQTMTQQDAGGGRNPFYHDMTFWWGKTSADGNAGGAYRMPYQGDWPYQANSFSLGTATASNNARLTWGTQYGFLGQQSYVVNDGVVATASGWPKKSYSTHVVLGPHSASPVETQLAQVETVQTLTLNATIGTVVSAGPAGVARNDNVTYAPAGYNHVYGALALAAAGNALDVNIAVGSGTLRKPLIIVSNWTAGYPTVKLAGATLTADVHYFPSLRASANELWLTLSSDLSGAVNRLQLSVAPVLTSPQSMSVDPDGNAVMEAGETVSVRPSWKNETNAPAALNGALSNIAGPPGPTYSIVDASGSYSMAAGATASCADCYAIITTGARPVQHWDMSVSEQLSDGSQHLWVLHFGGSFGDVPQGSIFYGFAENLLHNGITQGCAENTFCVSANVLRDQMAAFLARSIAGSDGGVPSSGTAQGMSYNCVPGGVSLFADVSPGGTFCRYIHFIYSRNVTAGKSPGMFAPQDGTARGEMAIFVSRALVQPAGDAGIPVSYLDPLSGRSYDCNDALPNHFPDVPDGSLACRHIHYIWARQVVDGNGDGTYGPSDPVTRGQMSKFLVNAFAMKLYEP